MTDDPFGPHNLPYGAFARRRDGRAGAGVRVGDGVLDLTAAGVELFEDGTLDRLLAGGPDAWADVRAAVAAMVAEDPPLVPLTDVEPVLPFAVADYVDFYASEHHATNVGRLFRPDGDALTPNWRHLPIGYHGRAGTVVVSGTPVRRPCGQQRLADGSVVLAPSGRLDFEAEVGFVVGTPSALGDPVPLSDFEAHVFGACLVNDWSARDIQAWEYVPLGPFLGKSFATSVSPWIVPLAALQAARVDPPTRRPRPLPYLDDAGAEPWGLDLRLEVRLNDHVLSRPRFAAMYWTPAQMLAHLTVNGASLRTGDLYASGTVSGPDDGQWGSLLELTRNGAEPLTLPGGSTRTFLEDGDEVVVGAVAAGRHGRSVGLGDVRGRIIPPRPERGRRPRTRPGG